MKRREQAMAAAGASAPVETADDYEETTPAPAPAAKPRRVPKLKGTAYEKLMHKLGQLVVLALTIGLWYAGASFTLQWLASMGMGIDTIYIWLVPAAITVAEYGLQRTKETTQTIIWCVVLAFDVFTTATGLHHYVRHVHGIAMPAHEYIVLVGGVGFILALAPERLLKSVIAELRR
jgi:hypothetical protein